MKKTDKKSPLQTPPRKRAGGSLHEKIWDKYMRPMLYFCVFVFFCIGYLVRDLLDFSSVWHKWVYAIVVPFGIFAFFFTRRADRDIADFLLGMDGERAVADELANLGRCDSEGRILWREFHDVTIPQGGNADHVLVCETGVYCLETKALRKGALDSLVFDGERVCRNGAPLLKPDPVAQARANAACLAGFLAAQGHKIFVKPIVVFPGWTVARGPAGKSGKAGILVCGEKELGNIIEKSRQKFPEEHLLSPQKIAAIAKILDAANRTE